jgi:general secretion pathway protein A
MYERFYGLTEHPFSLTPDPDFLFINQNFRDALDRMTQAVNQRESITVLTGDVGTGKTTLCWALLLRMQKKVRTALILNPLLNIDDLLRAIVQDFKIKPLSRRAPWHAHLPDRPYGLEDTSRLLELNRKQLIDELNRFLLEGVEADFSNVLVVDEAQNLTVECLELLRILACLEASKRKLLQIILAGQLELDQTLKIPELRQLRQTVAVHCSLEPLSKSDMTQYIYHRLWKAGADRSLSFSNEALNSVYEHSSGYPRLINVICDRTLTVGCNNRSWRISDKMVHEALMHLGMRAKKTAFFPLSSSVKAALAATAGVIILAGLIYFIRPWNFRANIADHRQNAGSPLLSVQPLKSSASSGPEPLTVEQSNTEARPTRATGALPLFFLQVHSLSTQQQADRALSDLKRKGYPAFQRILATRNQSRLYVIYIGPFADSSAAQEAATRLLESDGLHAILRTDISTSN